MVQFDLPVETPEERRVYVRFRKQLLALGFTRHQNSIYIRWEETDGQGEGTVHAVREALPAAGDIAIFVFSERTMSASRFYHDGTRVSNPEAPSALALF